MLPRILPASRVLLNRALFNGAPLVRCMSDHHEGSVEVLRERRSTLNDLPSPQGSWQENYNKRNAKWNMYLAVSALLFVGTIVAMERGGVFLFHTAPDHKKVNVSSR